MRIPIIKADYPLQVVNQPNVGLGAATEARVSGQVTDLVGEISRQQGELIQKEKIAQDTLTALEIDNQIRKETLDLEQSFSMDSDYQNFDKKMAEGLKSIQSKIQLKDPSNALKVSVQRSLNHYSGNLFTAVTARKYKIINDRGQVAIGEFVDNAAEEYAATDDPTEKAIIKKKAEMQIRTMIDSNGVDPVWGENQIRGFEKYAKAKEVDYAEAVALERMTVDPKQLAIDLKNPDYLPGLTDKSQRARLTNRAMTAAKIQENEQEAKINKAKQEAHDAESRAIGDAFLKGDYNDAYALTQKSKTLTGAEKINLGKAIEAAQATGPRIDPVKEAQAITQANDMIAKGEDPNKVKEFITFNPNLSGANKKQYINKVDAELSSETDEGRKRAYSDIKDVIIPKRGMLATLIQTPLETISVNKAQMALDDWLDAETKAGRYHSINEIRTKAMDLATQFQVPIAAQMQYMEDEAKRQAAEIKAAKGKK